jgi:Holliday junction resolvase RusA-like endonuclease
MENEKKNIVYRQNSKIDFLFGYFGELQVPTKQDAFKPINIIHTDENGVETILKDFYVKKPETKSVNNFKNYIQSVAREKFTSENIIKMPSDVQVHLSISVNQKRYHEVDVDNLAKTVLDCLKGIAFDDDCQVSSLIVDKHIHPMKVNGIMIAITKITEERKGLEFK